jgi:GDP-L-fucose synthase
MIDARISEGFASKNVLVTGGTGLIGRQVVDLLVAAGAQVRVVSLDQLNINEKARYVAGDLSSFDFCKEMVKDMDFVFHLAGVQGTVQTSSSKLASHFVPTLMVNTNVLEAARLGGVERLVYTSTIGAYEDREILRESDYTTESKPMSFAGWAKRMAELQIHAYKKQYGISSFSVVRLGNIYGPGDNFEPETALVIPSLMYRIHRGENPLVVWGDGSVVRDFLFSRDAAEGIIRAIHFGTDGEFINIASGRGATIREVVETLRSFIGFDYTFDADKPSGAPRRVMDIAVARERLGFTPTVELADGLKETWQWFMGHPKEYEKKLNYFLQ